MRGYGAGQIGDGLNVKYGFHANCYKWHMCQLARLFLPLVSFVGSCANMNKGELLSVIKARLKERRITAAEASLQAVGNPYLISNMGRERYGLPSIENLVSLGNVLGLELRFGPRRETGPILSLDLDSDDFAAVPRYDAAFSAGPGTDNSDNAPAGAIAFRRDWLARENISPGSSLVVSVKGDSMSPTLCDGDLVLVDRRKTTPTGRRIYALIGPDGEARIKRVERLPMGLLLQSDNDTTPSELIPAADANRVSILGEVVWWGHTVRE